MSERLPLRRILVQRPGPAASVVALVCLWYSFAPSLLPRSALIQGVTSGVSFALGLAVGTLLAAGARAVFRVLDRPVPVVLGERRWPVLGALLLVVVVAGLPMWLSWQNRQRDLVTMERLPAVSVITVLLVTPIVAVVLVLLGRLVAYPVRLLDRALGRRLPPWAARTVVVVVTAVFAVVISRDVVASRIVDGLDQSFGLVDTTTEEGVQQPVSPSQSGGPGSLVQWDDLGFQGRTFAGTATTADELRAFAGPTAEVTEPIRVYVGLRSADSVDAQADLAVRELERTGAFDRKVLAVVGVTGTGWVNPAASRALELMYGGDTAMVGMQYSYLPSWISFLVDLDKAATSGRALVDAVRARWEQLPPERRPKLVVFGESLGSYATEAAFDGPDLQASLQAATTDVDGVLWVGPTFANPIWHQVVDGRAPGAPTWQPAGAEGSPVRVLGHPDDPPVGGPAPRGQVVYLSHPTDPVTWASVDTLWRRPRWMAEPLGYDVSPAVRWFPGVTFVQSLFDLMAGFSAPPGHGHDYQPSFAAGWAAIVAPDGWTAADTARLQAALPPSE